MSDLKQLNTNLENQLQTVDALDRVKDDEQVTVEGITYGKNLFAALNDYLAAVKTNNDIPEAFLIQRSTEILEFLKKIDLTTLDLLGLGLEVELMRFTAEMAKDNDTYTPTSPETLAQMAQKIFTPNGKISVEALFTKNRTALEIAYRSEKNIAGTEPVTDEDLKNHAYQNTSLEAPTGAMVFTETDLAKFVLTEGVNADETQLTLSLNNKDIKESPAVKTLQAEKLAELTALAEKELKDLTLISKDGTINESDEAQFQELKSYNALFIGAGDKYFKLQKTISNNFTKKYFENFINATTGENFSLDQANTTQLSHIEKKYGMHWTNVQRKQFERIKLQLARAEFKEKAKDVVSDINTKLEGGNKVDDPLLIEGIRKAFEKILLENEAFTAEGKLNIPDIKKIDARLAQAEKKQAFFAHVFATLKKDHSSNLDWSNPFFVRKGEIKVDNWSYFGGLGGNKKLFGDQKNVFKKYGFDSAEEAVEMLNANKKVIKSNLTDPKDTFEYEKTPTLDPKNQIKLEGAKKDFKLKKSANKASDNQENLSAEEKTHEAVTSGLDLDANRTEAMRLATEYLHKRAEAKKNAPATSEDYESSDIFFKDEKFDPQYGYADFLEASMHSLHDYTWGTKNVQKEKNFAKQVVTATADNLRSTKIVLAGLKDGSDQLQAAMLDTVTIDPNAAFKAIDTLCKTADKKAKELVDNKASVPHLKILAQDLLKENPTLVGQNITVLLAKYIDTKISEYQVQNAYFADTQKFVQLTANAGEDGWGSRLKGGEWWQNAMFRDLDLAAEMTQEMALNAPDYQTLYNISKQFFLQMSAADARSSMDDETYTRISKSLSGALVQKAREESVNAQRKTDPTKKAEMFLQISELVSDRIDTTSKDGSKRNNQISNYLEDTDLATELLQEVLNFEYLAETKYGGDSPLRTTVQAAETETVNVETFTQNADKTFTEKIEAVNIKTITADADNYLGRPLSDAEKETLKYDPTDKKNCQTDKLAERYGLIKTLQVQAQRIGRIKQAQVNGKSPEEANFDGINYPTAEELAAVVTKDTATFFANGYKKIGADMNANTTRRNDRLAQRLGGYGDLRNEISDDLNKRADLMINDILGHGWGNMSDKNKQAAAEYGKMGALIVAGIAVGIATAGVGSFGVMSVGGAFLTSGAVMTTADALINNRGYDNHKEALIGYTTSFVTEGAMNAIGGRATAGFVRGLFLDDIAAKTLIAASKRSGATVTKEVAEAAFTTQAKKTALGRAGQKIAKPMKGIGTRLNNARKLGARAVGNKNTFTVANQIDEIGLKIGNKTIFKNHPFASMFTQAMVETVVDSAMPFEAIKMIAEQGQYLKKNGDRLSFFELVNQCGQNWKTVMSDPMTYAMSAAMIGGMRMGSKGFQRFKVAFKDGPTAFFKTLPEEKLVGIQESMGEYMTARNELQTKLQSSLTDWPKGTPKPTLDQLVTAFTHGVDDIDNIKANFGVEEAQAKKIQDILKANETEFKATSKKLETFTRDSITALDKSVGAKEERQAAKKERREIDQSEITGMKVADKVFGKGAEAKAEAEAKATAEQLVKNAQKITDRHAEVVKARKNFVETKNKILEKNKNEIEKFNKDKDQDKKINAHKINQILAGKLKLTDEPWKDLPDSTKSDIESLQKNYDEAKRASEAEKKRANQVANTNNWETKFGKLAEELGLAEISADRQAALKYVHELGKATKNPTTGEYEYSAADIALKANILRGKATYIDATGRKSGLTGNQVFSAAETFHIMRNRYAGIFSPVVWNALAQNKNRIERNKPRQATKELTWNSLVKNSVIENKTGDQLWITKINNDSFEYTNLNTGKKETVTHAEFETTTLQFPDASELVVFQPVKKKRTEVGTIITAASDPKVLYTIISNDGTNVEIIKVGDKKQTKIVKSIDELKNEGFFKIISGTEAKQKITKKIETKANEAKKTLAVVYSQIGKQAEQPETWTAADVQRYRDEIKAVEAIFNDLEPSFVAQSGDINFFRAETESIKDTLTLLKKIKDNIGNVDQSSDAKAKLKLALEIDQAEFDAQSLIAKADAIFNDLDNIDSNALGENIRTIIEHKKTIKDILDQNPDLLSPNKKKRLEDALDALENVQKSLEEEAKICVDVAGTKSPDAEARRIKILQRINAIESDLAKLSFGSPDGDRTQLKARLQADLADPFFVNLPIETLHRLAIQLKVHPDEVKKKNAAEIMAVLTSHGLADLDETAMRTAAQMVHILKNQSNYSDIRKYRNKANQIAQSAEIEQIRARKDTPTKVVPLGQMQTQAQSLHESADQALIVLGNTEPALVVAAKVRGKQIINAAKNVVNNRKHPKPAAPEAVHPVDRATRDILERIYQTHLDNKTAYTNAERDYLANTHSVDIAGESYTKQQILDIVQLDDASFNALTDAKKNAFQDYRTEYQNSLDSNKSDDWKDYEAEKAQAETDLTDAIDSNFGTETTKIFGSKELTKDQLRYWIKQYDSLPAGTFKDSLAPYQAIYAKTIRPAALELEADDRAAFGERMNNHFGSAIIRDKLKNYNTLPAAEQAKLYDLYQKYAAYQPSATDIAEAKINANKEANLKYMEIATATNRSSKPYGLSLNEQKAVDKAHAVGHGTEVGQYTKEQIAEKFSILIHEGGFSPTEAFYILRKGYCGWTDNVVAGANALLNQSFGRYIHLDHLTNNSQLTDGTGAVYNVILNRNGTIVNDSYIQLINATTGTIHTIRQDHYEALASGTADATITALYPGVPTNLKAVNLGNNYRNRLHARETKKTIENNENLLTEVGNYADWNRVSYTVLDKRRKKIRKAINAGQKILSDPVRRSALTETERTLLIDQVGDPNPPGGGAATTNKLHWYEEQINNFLALPEHQGFLKRYRVHGLIHKVNPIEFHQDGTFYKKRISFKGKDPWQHITHAVQSNLLYRGVNALYKKRFKNAKNPLATRNGDLAHWHYNRSYNGLIKDILRDGTKKDYTSSDDGAIKNAIQGLPNRRSAQGDVNRYGAKLGLDTLSIETVISRATALKTTASDMQGRLGKSLNKNNRREEFALLEAYMGNLQKIIDIAEEQQKLIGAWDGDPVLSKPGISAKEQNDIREKAENLFDDGNNNTMTINELEGVIEELRHINAPGAAPGTGTDYLTVINRLPAPVRKQIATHFQLHFNSTNFVVQKNGTNATDIDNLIATSKEKLDRTLYLEIIHLCDSYLGHKDERIENHYKDVNTAQKSDHKFTNPNTNEEAGNETFSLLDRDSAVKFETFYNGLVTGYNATCNGNQRLHKPKLVYWDKKETWTEEVKKENQNNTNYHQKFNDEKNTAGKRLTFYQDANYPTTSLSVSHPRTYNPTPTIGGIPSGRLTPPETASARYAPPLLVGLAGASRARAGFGLPMHDLTPDVRINLSEKNNETRWQNFDNEIRTNKDLQATLITNLINNYATPLPADFKTHHFFVNETFLQALNNRPHYLPGTTTPLTTAQLATLQEILKIPHPQHDPQVKANLKSILVDAHNVGRERVTTMTDSEWIALLDPAAANSIFTRAEIFSKHRIMHQVGNFPLEVARLALKRGYSGEFDPPETQIKIANQLLTDKGITSVADLGKLTTLDEQKQAYKDLYNAYNTLLIQSATLMPNTADYAKKVAEAHKLKNLLDGLKPIINDGTFTDNPNQLAVATPAKKTTPKSYAEQLAEDMIQAVKSNNKASDINKIIQNLDKEGIARLRSEKMELLKSYDADIPVKEFLERYIEKITDTDEATRRKAIKTLGMSGMPGVGKTVAADAMQAMAAEDGRIDMMTFEAGELENKYIGESAVRAQKIYRKLTEICIQKLKDNKGNKPVCINLILDEVDNYAAKSTGTGGKGKDDLRAALQKEMEKLNRDQLMIDVKKALTEHLKTNPDAQLQKNLEEGKITANVLSIATTNYPLKIEGAFKDRIQKFIHVYPAFTSERIIKISKSIAGGDILYRGMPDAISKTSKTGLKPYLNLDAESIKKILETNDDGTPRQSVFTGRKLNDKVLSPALESAYEILKKEIDSGKTSDEISSLVQDQFEKILKEQLNKSIRMTDDEFDMLTQAFESDTSRIDKTKLEDLKTIVNIISPLTSKQNTYLDRVLESFGIKKSDFETHSSKKKSAEKPTNPDDVEKQDINEFNTRFNEITKDNAHLYTFVYKSNALRSKKQTFKIIDRQSNTLELENGSSLPIDRLKSAVESGLARIEKKVDLDDLLNPGSLDDLLSPSSPTPDTKSKPKTDIPAEYTEAKKFAPSEAQQQTSQKNINRLNTQNANRFVLKYANLDNAEETIICPITRATDTSGTTTITIDSPKGSQTIKKQMFVDQIKDNKWTLETTDPQTIFPNTLKNTQTPDELTSVKSETGETLIITYLDTDNHTVTKNISTDRYDNAFTNDEITISGKTIFKEEIDALVKQGKIRVEWKKSETKNSEKTIEKFQKTGTKTPQNIINQFEIDNSDFEIDLDEKYKFFIKIAGKKEEQAIKYSNIIDTFNDTDETVEIEGVKLTEEDLDNLISDGKIRIEIAPN